MDAVKLIGLFILCLAVPFALAGMWIWFWIWTSIAFLIGVWEAYGVFISKSKKTVSRQFWEFIEKHKTAKWVLLAGYIGFFGYLAGHLWFKW